MSMFSRTKTTPATDFEQATQAVQDISGDYTLDVSHTRLGFSARHAMVTTVRGQFQDYTGIAHVDAAEPGQLQGRSLTIQAGSIDTGNADRNGHLVSPDFFDVENNPEITFVSTEVERADDTTWNDHRRPDHQGHQQAGHDRVRADRLGPGPLRQPARRLRGQHRHQPQGLGLHLERRARDRRRARLRAGEAGLRHLRDPVRLTRTTSPPHASARRH